ncbi:hypothetical protein KKF04_03925 [Patescibacteria group bacterium]|nr:hypothetical protein [Patescibacteria group bacterium]
MYVEDPKKHPYMNQVALFTDDLYISDIAMAKFQDKRNQEMSDSNRSPFEYVNLAAVPIGLIRSAPGAIRTTGKVVSSTRAGVEFLLAQRGTVSLLGKQRKMSTMLNLLKNGVQKLAFRKGFVDGFGGTAVKINKSINVIQYNLNSIESAKNSSVVAGKLSKCIDELGNLRTIASQSEYVKLINNTIKEIIKMVIL